MKIEIDTKEDIHILRHIIQLLHSVSASAGTKSKYEFQDTSSMFGSSSDSSPTPAPPVENAAPLFGMFDTPNTSSSTSSSSSDSFSSIFSSNEVKKDNNKGDFLDTLQVY